MKKERKPFESQINTGERPQSDYIKGFIANLQNFVDKIEPGTEITEDHVHEVLEIAFTDLELLGYRDLEKETNRSHGWLQPVAQDPNDKRVPMPDIDYQGKGYKVFGWFSDTIFIEPES